MEVKAVFPGGCSKVFKHHCVGKGTASNVYLTFVYPPKGKDFVDVNTIAECIESTGSTPQGPCEEKTPMPTTTLGEAEDQKEDAPVLDMRNPAGWSKEQVGQWLTSLGQKYQPVAQTFVDTGVDGEFLMDIGDEDLVELGMKSRVMRKIVLKKIAGFNAPTLIPRQGEPDPSPEVSLAPQKPLLL